MNSLREFWSRFDKNHLRIVAGVLLVIATVLMWSNSRGTTWSHVGFALLLVTLVILMFGIYPKRR